MKPSKTRLTAGLALFILGLSAIEFISLSRPSITTDLAMQTVNGSASDYAIMRAGGGIFNFLTFAATVASAIGLGLIVSAYFNKHKNK